jgi:hypothetical protein
MTKFTKKRKKGKPFNLNLHILTSFSLIQVPKKVSQLKNYNLF